MTNCIIPWSHDVQPVTSTYLDGVLAFTRQVCNNLLPVNLYSHLYTSSNHDINYRMISVLYGFYTSTWSRIVALGFALGDNPVSCLCKAI